MKRMSLKHPYTSLDLQAGYKSFISQILEIYTKIMNCYFAISQQEENKSSSGTVDPRLHEEKPSVDENEVDMEKEVKDTEEPMGDSNENKEEINSAFYTSQVALVMAQKVIII